MGVLELLLYLILLGVGLHLVLTYIEMPPPFKTLITVVVFVVALLLVLRAFGIDVTVPKLR
jgi:hypothetical protein